MTDTTSQDWQDLPAGVSLHGKALTFGELDTLRTLTHDQLMALEFEPQPWIVPGLLPAGLAVLVSAPKVGKTWLAMQLVDALAAGGDWLHWKLDAGVGSRCYWMENSHQTLQDRFKRVRDDPPAGMPIVHTVERFDGETLDERLRLIAADIEQRITSGFPLRLVTVDTLQLLQGLGRTGENAYKADVMALAALRRIALRHRICILALHHTNKMMAAGETDDPLMSVSGSNGIIGTANTILIIQRPRGGDTGVLHVTGHQVGDQKIPMRFDKPLWHFAPDLDEDLAVTVGIENRVLSAIKAGADTIDQITAATPGLKRQQVTDALRELRDKAMIANDQEGRVLPVRPYQTAEVSRETSQAPHNALPKHQERPASDAEPTSIVTTPVPLVLLPCIACGQATAVRIDGQPHHPEGSCPDSPRRPAAPRGYQRAAWVPEDLTKHTVKTFNQLLTRVEAQMQTPVIMHPYPPGGREVPPPLRLIAKGAGTLVHEGSHNWTAEHVPREGQTVHPLDKNAAFLSALGAAKLPIGACQHYPARGPAGQRGIHRLDTWPAWFHNELPHPGGADPSRRRAKELWITSETLDLFDKWHESGFLDRFTITESWTSPPLIAGKHPVVRLQLLYKALRDARDAALAEGDEDLVDFIKRVYSVGVSTLGESTSNDRIWRPDWSTTIRSLAFANLHRAAERALTLGMTPVRVAANDELHVIGDPFAPERWDEGRKLNQWKRKGDPYAWR